MEIALTTAAAKPTQTERETCDHCWIFSGVRWSLGQRLGGSSAHEIRYSEAYFCQRCCSRFYVELPESHDSYHPVRYGATPKEGAR